MRTSVTRSLKAIACDTPVIVSDHCGIAPLVDGRAGIVTQYDAKAIAQSLRTLLNDGALYQRLKAGCPEVARRLSWKGLVRQMQTIYEEVQPPQVQIKTSVAVV